MDAIKDCHTDAIKDCQTDSIKYNEMKFRELLMHDEFGKVTVLLLSAPDGQQAILKLERNAFPIDSDSWNEILCNCRIQQIVRNNLYSSHTVEIPNEFSGCKSLLIYPCTEQHIDKFRMQQRFVIHESADDYQKMTLPYILEHQISIEWVYNVLDHKAETDRIIFEDSDSQNGFMLAPDLKWDGKQLSNLYVQAIVRRRGIKSIRDLTGADLKLLNNIRINGYKAIEDKYGIPSSQIKAFFHYQPTYYHLHVHFINVSYNAPGSCVTKAVLLEDVINNISLMPDFYQRATLSFIARENSGLYKLFKASRNC